MAVMLRSISPTERLPETLANLEAEALLIGAMMIENGIVPGISRKVSAEHFYEPAHRKVFAAIVRNQAEGKASNAALFKFEFEADEDLAKLGGVPYLARLTGNDAGLLIAKETAEQIRDLAVRRHIRDGLQTAWQSCADLAATPSDIVEYAQETISSAPIALTRALPGVIDPMEWTGNQAPVREFIIPGWIAKGACGLLSGQEGVGKSLLAQQMATCAAVGIPFLGLDIEHCKSAYITCEDPIDELWRRQVDINKSLGITMADISGKMLLVSLKGELGNELGVFDQQGRLTASDRYRQIEKTLVDFGANFAFLDNAAHFFTGNENARHDVAVFLGLVERLSERIDGAVILLAHPNKQHSQGNKQGNEYSGSTGWSAHVRNRLFLDWAPKDANGNTLGEDGRVLRKSKANYGKKGEEVSFRWHEWAFVRDEDLPDSVSAELREVSKANFENDTFLSCLRQRLKERRPVSESDTSRTYAPRTFAKMSQARGMTKEELEDAMNRLFQVKAIERGFLWVYKGEGKDAHGLRIVGEDPNSYSDDLPMTSDDLVVGKSR